MSPLPPDPSPTEATPDSEITQLLQAWQGGDQDAGERLMPLVLGELRRIAARSMTGEGPGHTLQPTAVVNEAFLRLIDQRCDWKTRAHFYGVAARLMRRVLTDHARRTRAQKRGEGRPLPLEEALDLAVEVSPALTALDRALHRLAEVDAQKARIVEYRYFGGLTGAEIAEVEGLSAATVQRHWQLAKAWLYREMERDAEG